MKLYIDTSDNKKTVVGLDNLRIEKISGPDKSQQVLVLIDQILKENNKNINEITEIEIETGAGLPAGRQGSFTGLRVGISIANAIGWTLGIPVNGEKMVMPKYNEENK